MEEQVFYITNDNTFSIETPGFYDMHYISWAQGGLTYPREIISILLNKNRMDVEHNLFNKINSGDETVCLYPSYNITLMPYSPHAKDPIIYGHFNDALKAQNLYVKASTLVFDMRSYQFYGENNNQDNCDYIEMIRHAYNNAKILGRADEDWWVIVYYGHRGYEEMTSPYHLLNQYLVSMPVFLKAPDKSNE